MAKVKIEFSPETTGLSIGDIDWSWCKQISDNVDISTDNCILTERGYGIYIIDNPNITEDTDFRIFLINNIEESTTSVFSLSDGNLAKESTLDQIRKLQTNKAVVSQDDQHVFILNDNETEVIASFVISEDKRVRTPQDISAAQLIYDSL